jgi:hypothetical protein
VAEGGVEDLDTHLHGLRRRHLHLLDRQRLPGLPCDRRCNEPRTKPVSPLSIIPNNNARVSSQINANFVGISQDRERTFALDHLPSSRHCRRSLAPKVQTEIKIDLCCFVDFAVRCFGEEGRRGEPCIYMLVPEESTSN